MKLIGIMIGSEDSKRLADYYTKVLGTPGWDENGFVGWQLGNGYVTVGPHDQVKGKNTVPGRILWNIETSDVKGDFEKFKAAGATVVQEPYKPDGSSEMATEMWVATFSDPDNNYFQLMSPM
jgi:predicted enzyme related to lactoylglutathione lyase